MARNIAYAEGEHMFIETLVVAGVGYAIKKSTMLAGAGERREERQADAMRESFERERTRKQDRWPRSLSESAS